MQTLRARQVPWSNPVAAGLRAALRAETTPRQGAQSAVDDDGADIAVFLIIYEVATGQPVGCGGLRRHADGHTDAAYIYVVPYARWSGVSAVIVEELACWARVHGITVGWADAAALDEAVSFRL